jgi:undecaprenyl phosphate N,N'-diacetylbacillosamine 1-phosphate transferase
MIDICLSIFGLILLFPVFIFLWLVLTISNRGGGAFFRQLRPGKNEKIFELIKFKTMTDERDKNGNLLPDVNRLTKIGLFVRSTSLDEIPQLLNVLKGHMSLIGPRPLLVSYLPLYNEVQKCRHNIRPGITGWAQVNGRNTISWEQKFEYDVWYVENVSFTLDAKIVFMTIRNVIKRKDINSQTSVTMEAFNGEN